MLRDRNNEGLDHFQPEDAPRVRALLRRAVEEKTDFETEYRALPPDGSTRHIHAVGHPVVNPSGEVVALIGTVMDVTERKQVERAVRRARDRTLDARFTRGARRAHALGMRERATQFRARLSLRSAPGHGTEVVLRIPYPISDGSPLQRTSSSS